MQRVVTADSPVMWKYTKPNGTVYMYKRPKPELPARIGEMLAEMFEDYPEDLVTIECGEEINKLTVFPNQDEERSEVEGSFPFKINGVIYNITFEKLDRRPSPDSKGGVTATKVLRRYEPVWST